MSKTFTSIGVTLVDFLASSIDELPPIDTTELIRQIRFCAAGTAAAPAVIAARHGIDTALIGAVGSDDIGELLMSLFERETIDLTLIQRRKDISTAATFIPVNCQGHRPNFHMPGAFLLLEPNEDIRNRLRNSDLIHWGGVGMLLNFDPDTTADLLSDARSNGSIVTADLIAPNEGTPEVIQALAPHFDWFMPSIDEALAISGKETVEAAADSFLEQGAQGCIIKCGSQGSYIMDQSGIDTFIPVTRDVRVVDTSGCGDSFCAGFNIGLAHSFDPIKACHFASAVAAQVASGLGSDGIVKDFETSMKIMDAGTMSVLEEGE